jgi:hypothetical protein
VRPKSQLEYTTGYEGNVHGVAKFLFEGGVIMQKSGNED